MEGILLDEHLLGKADDGRNDAAGRGKECLAGGFAFLQVGNLNDGKVYLAIETTAQTLSHMTEMHILVIYLAQIGMSSKVLVGRKWRTEYIELYNQNFERLRLPATGYEPRTFEIRTKMGEGATFKQAGTRYNLARNFYNGKPVIGATYYYYLTVDEGISQYFVELNGKLMDDVKLGTTVYPNSFRGIEPVYDLVVTTYRNYQEKELVINLEKAGQLKHTLATENWMYFWNSR